jgi:tetratricopeptide (TPR) repeat protein
MKEYPDAMEQLDLALKYGAHSASSLTLKGILVSILDQDYYKALRYFDSAIEEDEEHGRAWTNRGMALRQIGDQDGALYSFQKALMIDPNDKNARKMLINMGHEDFIDTMDRSIEDDDEVNWDS